MSPRAHCAAGAASAASAAVSSSSTLLVSLSLRYLCHRRALGLFLGVLLALTSSAIGLMAIIQAVDPPHNGTTTGAHDSDKLTALRRHESTLGVAGADNLVVRPSIHDTRITALQFVWLVSPLAATIALFIAMKRFEKQQEKEKAEREGPQSASSSARPPTTPREPPDSPRRPKVKAPTLGLERSAKLQPLVQTLLEPSTRSASPVQMEPPPQPTDTEGPALSALDAAVAAPAHAARHAVDTVADHLAVRSEPPAAFLEADNGAEIKSSDPDTATVSNDAAHVDEFAVSADLLLRMPYLPFLGLGLPTLLLQTRVKNRETLNAAYAAQPRLERLGLRLLLATHLPAPTTSLRKWIFRTRWAAMQRWPPLLAFLTAAVILPTAVPTVFACVQYVLASLSGAQGWSNPLALATIRKALHLANDVSDTTVIGLGFLYEAVAGVWWDIVPIESADWGNGLGFSGASWILLAICEEAGWLGALFPLLYYNPHVRDWAVVWTQWWYRDAAASGSSAPLASTLQSATATSSESAGAPTCPPGAISSLERSPVVKGCPARTRPHHSTPVRDSIPAAPTNPVVPAANSPHTRLDVAATPPSQPRALGLSASSTRGVAREWILTTLVCLILGTIWSAWHWPFILLKGQLPLGVGYVPGTVDTPLAYGFLMWVPRIIATRFVVVFLSLSAGSFWAGILFHAAHNVMVYSYWAVLPDTDGARYPFARYMHAESGLTVVIGYMLAAALIVVVWKRYDERYNQIVHISAKATKDAPQPRATSENS